MTGLRKRKSRRVLLRIPKINLVASQAKLSFNTLLQRVPIETGRGLATKKTTLLWLSETRPNQKKQA